MKKMKAVLGILLICFLVSTMSETKVYVKSGKVWVGIGYLAAKKGASPVASALISTISIVDAGTWAFAVGSVATPLAGAVAGAVVGL